MTIIAALYFIQAILWIIGAFTVTALLLPFVGVDPDAGAIALVCGGIFVVFAIINFVIGWGLLSLRGWARTFAIIFAILGLLNFPIGTVISVVILIYLFQPQVKYAFGKGPPPAGAYPSQYPPQYGAQYPPQYGAQYPPQYGAQQPPAYGPPAGAQAPAAPPAGTPPAPARTEGGGFCRSCGSPLAAGAKFCPKCGAPA